MLELKYHRYIFLFGVCALAYGMMMGTMPTSLPQMILLGNWLLEGRFAEKWVQVKKTKVLWFMVALFLLHVFGLFYTSDLTDGGNDVRIKLPMLFLPILFFTTVPLSKKELQMVLSFFLVGCFTNTAWCLVYTHACIKTRGFAMPLAL